MSMNFDPIDDIPLPPKPPEEREAAPPEPLDSCEPLEPLDSSEPLEPLEPLEQVEQVEQVPPPRVWTLLLMLLLAPVVYIVFTVMAVAVVMALPAGFGSAAGPDELFGGAVGLSLLIVFAHGSIALLAVAAALLSPRPWRERLGLVRPVVSWWAMLPILVGTMAFGWLNVLICAALFEAPSKGLEELFEMMTVFTGPAVVLGVMNVGLVAGTAEELIFRGYLQTRLLRRWGPLAAIVPVSVLFGLVHLDVQHALSAGIMGAWFGVLCWRTGSLWPAILCHAGYNAYVSIWYAVAGMPEQSMTYAQMLAGWDATDTVLFSLSGAALLFSMAILARARPESGRLIG